MKRNHQKREALSELAEVIEDLFYCADLMRASGQQAAAGRLRKIADDVARERVEIEREFRWVSS
jgi:hypothetical protein